MTRNGRPGDSTTAKTATTCSWTTAAAALASRRNRRRAAPQSASDGDRTLIATLRFRAGSNALSTTPMPAAAEHALDLVRSPAGPANRASRTAPGSRATSAASRVPRRRAPSGRLARYRRGRLEARVAADHEVERLAAVGAAHARCCSEARELRRGASDPRPAAAGDRGHRARASVFMIDLAEDHCPLPRCTARCVA